MKRCKSAKVKKYKCENWQDIKLNYNIGKTKCTLTKQCSKIDLWSMRFRGGTIFCLFIFFCRMKKKLDQQKKLNGAGKKWKTKQIRLILVNTKRWVDDLNMIILRYILLQYFKPLNVFRGHSGCVNSVNISPDNTKIVSSSYDKTIRIWDIKLGKEIGQLKGHLDPVSDAQFSSNGNMIYNFHSMEKTLYRVHEIIQSEYGNIQTGQEIKILKGHLNHVNNVQFSSSDQHILLSSDDRIIIIWNIESGERLNELTIRSGCLMKVKFSPNCNSIISCSTDKTIRVLDITTKKQIKQLNRYSDVINDVKYMPNSQIIVSCSDDKTIQLWDERLGIETQKLRGHCNEVTGIDISLNGNVIASSSNDRTIRLWKLL
ncbi:WD repeat-containing protein [Reticulomyxa filosa]|uniref:WD repeat-containing protein n=1 Tax=Reticulomyxa filosa TaxID=46433 RepID=X6P1A5_RETFI|nr:WD repeat-containing protein [Reticulomyxa filosa]|eukprot:ETO32021.1 WD repeat-containing protein [Reticulomyxa filosa]